MVLMVQSMQAMQKRFEEDKGGGRALEDGVEKVATGITEFPALPEWDAWEAPLKMGDWVTVLEPLVADMSATADEWWALMLREVNVWYQTHLALSPLDRAGHLPEVPLPLQEKRWRRLERRVAGLMIKAIPETQREEMVSRKCLTVFGILTTLQVSYQPGGLGEKRTLLKNLEEPNEASSAGEAVAVLRKWTRWRQRTNEIHATEPDPAVLMKGLTRLVHKVLDQNQELRFRVSLARSSLLVDSTPTKDSVTKYATHLMAELEQIAYAERKGNTKKEPHRLKKIEEDAKGLGKGGDRRPKEGEEAERPKPVCKFFNTEHGCRKGRQCKWLHQPDDKRRCYTCGSTKHMAPACPTAVDSPPRTKAFREGAEVPPAGGTTTRSSSSQDADAGSEASRSSGSVKNLIEEATQMLKSMSQKADPGATAKPSLEDLQRQLNELRGDVSSGSKMKTFRLTKMAPEGVDEMALLDSGATHPLRSLVPGDDLAVCQKVWVALADGHRVPMLMTPSGIMLSVDQKVEPIVPLGWLADRGCRITWTEKGLQVHHPVRGALPVSVHAGCPQVPKDLALEIIMEFERADKLAKIQKAVAEKVSEETLQEYQWLKDLLTLHPALKTLPQHIVERLAVKPGSWTSLPVNRHKRKRLKQGYVAHLYAGAAEGYTFEKAMQERGLSKYVLELDVKRGDGHDLLDDTLYGALLRTTLDGSLRGVIGGPNCRSRSVLRHYPGGPRPLRRWGGGRSMAWEIFRRKNDRQ